MPEEPEFKLSDTLSGSDATLSGGDELDELFLQSELDSDDATSAVLQPVAPDESADAEEWFIYALALLRQRQWTLAIEALQAALNRDPGHKSPCAARALGCMGYALARQDRWDEALDWYRKAIKITPDASEVWAALSVAQSKLGDEEGANTALEEGVRLNADHPIMLFNLGNLRLRQGRLDEAIEVYQRARALDPTHVHTMVNLGVALAAHRHLAQAAELLAEARRVDMTNWRATVNHAVVLAQLMDYPSAIEALGQACALIPASGRPRVMLARVLRCMHAGNDAITELEKAKDDPDYEAAAWEMLGLIHDDQGHDDQALAAWRSGLDADPAYVRLHTHIGRLHLKAGRLEEAEAAVAEAMRLRPGRAATWMLDGEVALSRRQKADAEAKLARAIEIDPELHAARYLLGKTLLQQGRLTEAVQHCETLARLESPLAERLRAKIG